MSSLWRVCTRVAMVLALAAPARAQQLSEQEIVDLAMRDGPRARAIRAGVNVARAEQQARTVYPNPSIGYSREGAGFTEFLQVEQAFPVWGVRAELESAGVAAVEAAEAERDVQLAALRAEVRTLVGELAAAQAAEHAADRAIGDMEKLAELLRAREREGEGSKFDRLRAERELSDARRSLSDARVRAVEARARLQATLPPNTTVTTLIDPQVPQQRSIPAVDGLLARARTARPELLALQRTALQFSHEASAARRARLPQPTVAVGAKRAEAGAGRERGGLFGLSLTVPLFDAGRREAARWEAERVRVQAEAIAVTNLIAADVTRAANTLSLREQAFADYTRTVLDQSDELRQIANAAYVEGELGILELLDAYRADWNARTQAVAMRLSVRLALIDLERAVGGAVWP